MSEDIEQRLRAWLDKLEIRDVLERYMRYNDDRAADKIAELFHEDGRFQVMGRVQSGREAVRSVFNDAGPELPHWTAPSELSKSAATETSFAWLTPWLIYTRTGVSVARPGEAGSDTEWVRALQRMSPEEKARLRH